MKGFFVAGTDTGVGKTEIARALCSLLRAYPLKPVETGCDPAAPADALALIAASGCDLSLDEVCPYRFRLPAAPLVAAQAEGVRVDVERVLRLVREPAVVEAAGGLMVPFAEGVLNVDLIQLIGLPVLLVGRAGLGTLNHCALSFEALARRGIAVAAIVLNRTGAQDDPTVPENPRWVRAMTGARVLGPAPFVSDASLRLEALAALLDPLVDTPEVRG